MGALLAVIFVFLVIAMGVGAIMEKVEKTTGKVKPKRIVEDSSPVSTYREYTTNRDFNVFLNALANEGYFGRVRLPDEEIEFIDNPILAKMIEKLDREYELEWTLPEYRLRLRLTPQHAPRSFLNKYTHVVMTPTHAIGFRRADEGQRPSGVEDPEVGEGLRADGVESSNGILLDRDR